MQPGKDGEFWGCSRANTALGMWHKHAFGVCVSNFAVPHNTTYDVWALNSIPHAHDRDPQIP